ncbi:MAG: hypothetical protein WEE64_13305 [Dehalococcoidia bacterium]
MSDENALDILACEIELRPRGAPGIEDIARAIVTVERAGPCTLAVEFDAAAAADVEAFAAAEQRCCSTLSWTVEHREGVTRLTIGAEPPQIDLLEEIF